MMNDERKSNEREPQNTAVTIALTLLWAFVASFGALLIINVCVSGWSDVDTRKAWFELMKSASILLGTALTTVIGYYFGQRESAQIRKEAQAAEARAETKTKIAESAEKKAESATTALENVTKSLEGSMPDDFNAARDDLQAPPN
jgi:hypothetical protein